MELSLFAPPQVAAGPVPKSYSGLTCTWENATTKAGLQAWAAEFGVIVVARTPARAATTSPMPRTSTTSARAPISI